MTTKVLDTVKPMLGIQVNEQSFDDELVIYVNEALAMVHELLPGSESPASISTGDDVWESLGFDVEKLPMIQVYVGLRTKFVFDPSPSPTVLGSLERRVGELAIRLTFEVEE